MRRFRILGVKTSAVVLCIAAMSPLYASRLNPVSWTLRAEQEKVAPGSTVVLHLHAEIADGYHLYSFTTPAGGPIKTKASLQPSPDIQGFRVFQPMPDRHQDPNLNVPVETFKSGVSFLLSVVLANSASPCDKVLIARVRYQACSDEICLPPVTKMATTSITVRPGLPVASPSVPNGYQLVTASASPWTAVGTSELIRRLYMQDYGGPIGSAE